MRSIRLQLRQCQYCHRLYRCFSKKTIWRSYIFCQNQTSLPITLAFLTTLQLLKCFMKCTAEIPSSHSFCCNLRPCQNVIALGILLWVKGHNLLTPYKFLTSLIILFHSWIFHLISSFRHHPARNLKTSSTSSCPSNPSTNVFHFILGRNIVIVRSVWRWGWRGKLTNFSRWCMSMQHIWQRGISSQRDLPLMLQWKPSLNPIPAAR